MKPQIVLTTTSSLAEAQKLAQAALQEKLAACVQILPGMESHYWWKDKMETAAEWLVIFKTSTENFSALSSVIQKNHSYECPEITALPPEKVEENYLRWWQANLKSS